jgi:hypothetical protein
MAGGVEPYEWQRKKLSRSVLNLHNICKPKSELVFTILFAFCILDNVCCIQKINLLQINTHNSTAVSPASHAGQLMAVKGVGHCHGAAAVSLWDEQKTELNDFFFVTEQRDVGTLAACPCRAKKSKDCSVPLGSCKKESMNK